MTPQEYCARLEKALKAMPPEERQETIRYYLEFLEEASEAERSALGTPEQLAARLLQENGILQTPDVPRKKNRAAAIVALACTFYIWLPLLVCWYVLLLCAVICIVVIPISLAACLPLCMFEFIILLLHDIPLALLALGMGFACAGIAILLMPPFWIACRAVIKFTIFTTKKMWNALF